MAFEWADDGVFSLRDTTPEQWADAIKGKSAEEKMEILNTLADETASVEARARALEWVQAAGKAVLAGLLA